MEIFKWGLVLMKKTKYIIQDLVIRKKTSSLRHVITKIDSILML